MTNEAFFDAVKAGDAERVRKMVMEDPRLASARSAGGTSAVLTAIYYGEPGVADELIRCGVQLDIFEAAATGRLERVRALLDRDPQQANAIAPDGFQPLGLAAFFGHTEVARLLLERGAQVNSASHNPQQVMPLHSAVAGRHLEIARLLLEHGADANAAQQDGFTPMDGAVQNQQAEMIALLKEYGARTAKFKE